MRVVLSPTALAELKAFRARLAKLPAAYARLEARFLKTAARISRVAFRSQFRTRGAAFGLTWAALAPSTLRGRTGRARMPLMGTGKLMQDVGRASNTRIVGGTLTMRTQARTRKGARLVPLHAAGGPRLPVRMVAHPVTGIAGAALAQVQTGWREVGSALAREGNGGGRAG